MRERERKREKNEIKKELENIMMYCKNLSMSGDLWQGGVSSINHGPRDSSGHLELSE